MIAFHAVGEQLVPSESAFCAHPSTYSLTLTGTCASTVTRKGICIRGAFQNTKILHECFQGLFHWALRAGSQELGANIADAEQRWYEEMLATFPGNAALLCGFARFQQVVRKDKNRAAKLYETALVSNPNLARKTALKLYQTEMAMQVVDQPISLVDQIIQLRSIATGGRTLKRGEKHLKGRDMETALVHPDLIDREIPENFQEGKHYMVRGEGFPRGISWVYPGDLVVVRRCESSTLSIPRPSPLFLAHTHAQHLILA
jgi:hypothetical protein